MRGKKSLLLFIAIFSTCFAADAQQLQELKGIVTTFEERPLASISISLKNGDYYSGFITSTDSLGRFTIPDVHGSDTILFDGMQIGGSRKVALRGNNYLHVRFPLVRKEMQGPDIRAIREVPKTSAPQNRKDYSEPGAFYCVFDVPAQPAAWEKGWGGGWQAFNNWVKSSLIYPEEARKNSIEGVVVAGFKITKKGKLRDLKILRGIGFGCDEEVLRVLSAPAMWAIAVYVAGSDQEFEYAVEFKLSDKQ